jgi:hypothetical protein
VASQARTLGWVEAQQLVETDIVWHRCWLASLWIFVTAADVVGIFVYD